MAADDELSKKLAKRNQINEGNLAPEHNKKIPISAEFKEFSIKEISSYTTTFKSWDANHDGYIEFEDLKRMMEKLGCPQTHLSLKAMIKEVEEEGRPGNISLRGFLLIFRKGRAGELEAGSGLHDLYEQLSEIDVSKEGVAGAASFFESKVKQQFASSKFENEIREEQEAKKKDAQERKDRALAFKKKAGLFEQTAAT
jgi:hypothetical protein